MMARGFGLVCVTGIFLTEDEHGEKEKDDGV